MHLVQTSASLFLICLILVIQPHRTMPATIYLITGGCRSGKSSYAQQLCEELCPNPIYLATAAKTLQDGDDDFTQRIQKHQQDRGEQWTTIEEPLKPSQFAEQFSGRAVLVDCLTLWMTNYLLEEGAFTVDGGSDKTKDEKKQSEKETTDACARAFTKIKEEFETLTKPYDVTFVFVTNEVGSGTHAESHISRKFVDYQGWFNQYVGSKAQQVIHMVAGQPNVLKNELNRQSIREAKQHAKALEAQRLDRHLSTRQVPMDPKGYFLVKADPDECLIIASFHSCMINDKGEVCDLEGKKIPCCGEDGKKARPEPMKVWKCRTAKELTTEIFERWEGLKKAELSVGHAAYIGREAQRAEHCLYATGQKFQQD